MARLKRRGGGLFLNFRLPGPLVTLGQTSLGIIDVCAAAGSLYALLPKGHALGYLAFCALYSFAAMVGIASHSPGGLGVFEVTMLKGVGGDADQLLASLADVSGDLLSDTLRAGARLAWRHRGRAPLAVAARGDVGDRPRRRGVN